jgi:hypothetical protein
MKLPIPKKCSMCKNKLLKELSNLPKNNRHLEHYKQNQEDDEYEYEEDNNYDEESNFNILETFDNITPSQKNLLLIIIYGILIIVVTDLVIKDPK